MSNYEEIQTPPDIERILAIHPLTAAFLSDSNDPSLWFERVNPVYEKIQDGIQPMVMATAVGSAFLLAKETRIVDREMPEIALANYQAIVLLVGRELVKVGPKSQLLTKLKTLSPLLVEKLIEIHFLSFGIDESEEVVKKIEEIKKKAEYMALWLGLSMRIGAQLLNIGTNSSGDDTGDQRSDDNEGGDDPFRKFINSLNF